MAWNADIDPISPWDARQATQLSPIRVDSTDRCNQLSTMNSSTAASSSTTAVGKRPCTSCVAERTSKVGTVKEGMWPCTGWDSKLSRAQ
jgi:hypothetical protein